MLSKLESDQVATELRAKQLKEQPDMTMGQNEDYQKLDAEMSRRRIERLKREYEMLNFCFTASSILFKEI
jgi:hypothetical protein